jgi:pilus assembly protein CpaB
MKRWLPIVLAVVLAIIAAALVFFYTRGAEQRVLDEQQPVTVLVSTSTVPRGISLGDAVAGGLAEETQVPADMAPTGAIGGVTPENSALLAINQVNPGQILLSTNFAAELPDITPVSIPDGLIAIAISLGDVQRVGNFLRPGAEVVIFNSYTSGEAQPAEGEGEAVAGPLTTRVLVDRALVLGVGETATPPTTNPDGTTTVQAPSSLITLGVDQPGAEKIIQASQTGSLYFGLLGDGTEIVRSNGTTDGNLFD